MCTARPFQAYFVAKNLVSRFAAKTRPAFRGLRRKPGQRFAVCGGNTTWQMLQARRAFAHLRDWPGQACCGVVSNDGCDVSIPRGAVFTVSAPPPLLPKPAIACTS